MTSGFRRRRKFQDGAGPTGDFIVTDAGDPVVTDTSQNNLIIDGSGPTPSLITYREFYYRLVKFVLPPAPDRNSGLDQPHRYCRR